ARAAGARSAARQWSAGRAPAARRRPDADAAGAGAAMSGDRGYTLVELLIATAIMLTVTSAVMTMLHDGLVRGPVLEDSTDLHQRARIAADAIGADLRAAGNGTSSGPLSAVLPGVEPRWATAPSASASTNAVTVRYVPPLAA
ncbi:MAG: prepilin-type N-terminal cleavage/methylation domain-containing protein, partial [Acidobacteria bacterium]|nr:prepilin-type N-terminal cleavage/methylation domain-containing protein [Acidobacteriota bacterium]